MEAGKRNLNDILNRSRILEIPHFQRSYVWKEEQWERFLDDMILISTMNTNYFMGSIILKQQETSSEYRTGDVRTIIDGQQRLTTLSLFFKALYTKLDTSEKFNEVFKTHNNELILVHNFSDRPVFEKILLDLSLENSDYDKNIAQCYKFFLNNIEVDEINPNSLLGNIIFVGIDLNQGEDEQQIFDTINSLGVSLTTAELLKNYLFNKNIELYDTHWKSVFETDEPTRDYWNQEVTAGRNKRANIDLFLQSFLMIKIQQKEYKVSAEEKERYFKIESVFSSFKDFMKKHDISVNVIAEEIREYATIYKKNIVPNLIDEDIDESDRIERLNIIMFALDTATIIPYVMYILKECHDQEERTKLFTYLESYIVRRIICKETTKNYNQLFRSTLINNEVNSYQKLKEEIEKKEDKVNFMPDDKLVSEAFKASKLTNKQARGVLYLLEKSIRSHLQSTDLKPITAFTLEHVMPKKWENKWKTKLSEQGKSDRNNLLLTLGNLTIITSSLNSSIRDSDWKTKKAGKGKHKGLQEYAAGVEIFNKYLELNDWDESSIFERAIFLTDKALNEVWKL